MGDKTGFAPCPTRYAADDCLFGVPQKRGKWSAIRDACCLHVEFINRLFEATQVIQVGVFANSRLNTHLMRPLDDVREGPVMVSDLNGHGHTVRLALAKLKKILCNRAICRFGELK